MTPEQIRHSMQQRRFADAVAGAEALCRREPDNADGWGLLGAAQQQLQRWPAAIAALRKAVALRANDRDLRIQLGMAAMHSGDVALGREQFEWVLRVDPNHATAAASLGFIAQNSGDLGAAERYYRIACASAPDQPDVRHNLGTVLRLAGRLGEAHEQIGRARALAPRRFDIALSMAWICLDTGQYRAAVDHADAAIELAPRNAAAWLALGSAWRYLGAYKTAQKTLQQAAMLAPDDGAIARELAVALQEKGDFGGALAEFARARRLDPDNAEYRWRDLLATCTFPQDQAQAEQAHARFADGIELLLRELAEPQSPMWPVAFWNMTNTTPFHLHYYALDSTATTKRFGDLVALIAGRRYPELSAPPDWRALAHGGRARIGFTCSALRDHTLAFYFSNWLTGLDRERFEVFVWNLSAQTDAVTERLAAAVEHFHNVGLVQAGDVAARIRAARLDAVVHLDVGMDGNMQALAAMRLAPVQCAGYGHPVTTGLRSVDYYLSGEALEPADGDRHYREKLVRLPGLGVVPLPPPQPGDGDWLVREPGRPLLVCAQNVIKITPQFDVAVARIAAATDARIVFIEGRGYLIEALRARLATHFNAAGIDLDRHVAAIRWQAHPAYLAGLAKADLVLDTPNFSGGRSSLDALSVGTPVVAWEGGFMRGRQTAAMLRIIDAQELIAHDIDGYVDTVATLCKDAVRRQRVRAAIAEARERLFAAETVIPALGLFLVDACRRAAAAAS